VETTKQPLPSPSKVGLVVMTFGFLFDLVEHTLVVHSAEPTIGAFPLSEHAAHLVVIVGMVLVLAGVVLQGSQPSTRAHRRTQRRDLDAIR
jgi:hypothetical protein